MIRAWDKSLGFWAARLINCRFGTRQTIPPESWVEEEFLARRGIWPVFLIEDREGLAASIVGEVYHEWNYALLVAFEQR
jgi:hypothetical protein